MRSPLVRPLRARGGAFLRVALVIPYIWGGTHPLGGLFYASHRVGALHRYGAHHYGHEPLELASQTPQTENYVWKVTKRAILEGDLLSGAL